MVVPLIAGAAAAAPAVIGWGARLAPHIISAISALAPSVIDAFTGSTTEEEAKEKLRPQREAMLHDLRKEGIDRREAVRIVDSAMQEQVQHAMDGGGMPIWADLALSAATGYGGFKLGKWLMRGKGAKAAATAAGKVADTAKVAETAASPAAAGAAKQVAGELPLPPAPAAAGAAPAAAAATPGPEAILGTDQMRANYTKKIGSPFASRRATDDELFAQQQRVAQAETAVPARAPEPDAVYGGRKTYSDEETMGFAGRAPARSPFYRGKSEVSPEQQAQFANRAPPRTVDERGYGTDPGLDAGDGPRHINSPFAVTQPMSREEVAFWKQRLSPRQAARSPRMTPSSEDTSAMRTLEYEVPSMPTAAHEDRLRELAQGARRFSKTTPGAGSRRMHLPLDEEEYMRDAMLRNPQDF